MVFLLMDGSPFDGEPAEGSEDATEVGSVLSV
jgi:hypothetical protein